MSLPGGGARRAHIELVNHFRDFDVGLFVCDFMAWYSLVLKWLKNSAAVLALLRHLVHHDGAIPAALRAHGVNAYFMRFFTGELVSGLPGAAGYLQLYSYWLVSSHFVHLELNHPQESGSCGERRLSADRTKSWGRTRENLMSSDSYGMRACSQWLDPRHVAAMLEALFVGGGRPCC